MQQNSRVDVISKLNGTICRLGNSVDSLRVELNRLKSGNTDIHLHYKQKLERVIENNEESICQRRKGNFSGMDDKNSEESISLKKTLGKNKSEHDITLSTNLQYDIENTSGDMNITSENRTQTKRKLVNLEHVTTVKEDGDILMLPDSSKNTVKKVRVEKNRTGNLEIDPSCKKSKKINKYHKMKPLINFNERHARERLHSIKERIIALTQELPAIESQLEEDSKVHKILKDKKHKCTDSDYQQSRFINNHQPVNYNDKQVNYKNAPRPDSSTTWREQKNRIRDKLKVGAYKLDFKGSNISKVIGYGERIRN